MAIYIFFFDIGLPKWGFLGAPGAQGRAPCQWAGLETCESMRESGVWSGGAGGWMPAHATTRLIVVGSTLDFMGYFFHFFLFLPQGTETSPECSTYEYEVPCKARSL